MFDLTQYSAVLLDMDGVLYRGLAPLPGANELLALFERRGIAYACVTNNTTLTPEEGIVPGAGSLLALLRAAPEVEPFVIGKPAPTMLRAAIQILGADARRTLVVGDRLDTDIAGAKAADLTSALVLTGVT